MTGQLSHLARAVLRCLPGPRQPVTRDELRVLLAADEWVIRNQHRLARLDSTLAQMSEAGLIRLDGMRTVERTG